jgi:hypothetical protein
VIQSRYGKPPIPESRNARDWSIIAEQTIKGRLGVSFGAIIVVRRPGVFSRREPIAEVCPVFVQDRLTDGLSAVIGGPGGVVPAIPAGLQFLLAGRTERVAIYRRGVDGAAIGTSWHTHMIVMPTVLINLNHHE